MKHAQRRTAALVLISVLVGCGAGQPTDESKTNTATSEATSLEKAPTHFQEFSLSGPVAPADSPIPPWVGDVANVSGIGGTLFSVVTAVIGWLGGGPSNQDILNQITVLEGQVTDVESKLDKLITDYNNTTVMLSSLSGQSINLAVHTELANYTDLAMNDINYYTSHPGASSQYLVDINNYSFAAADYFSQSAFYYQLSPSGTWTFTPLFALMPYLRSLQVRFLAYSVFDPGWKTDPYVKAELIHHRDTLNGLIPLVKSWADAQCSVRTTFTCLEWEIVYPKHLICDYGYYSYTASCPAGSTLTSMTQYSNQADAKSAAYQALQTSPQGYAAVEGAAQLTEIQQIVGQINGWIAGMP